MSERNTFVMDGIKTEWDDSTITITELGMRHRATLTNDGRILASTFGSKGEGFVRSYFLRMKPMVERMREIDREYADA